MCRQVLSSLPSSPLLYRKFSVWCRDTDTPDSQGHDDLVENYDHYFESSEQRADPLAKLKSKLKMEKPFYRGKPVDKERFKKGQ